MRKPPARIVDQICHDFLVVADPLALPVCLFIALLLGLDDAAKAAGHGPAACAVATLVTIAALPMSELYRAVIRFIDQRMSRYLMLIPAAARPVTQAGAMAKGGDGFVLDMGEPVRTVDLARAMIVMSGLSEKTARHPRGDIEIKFVGLFPSEKLNEELLTDGKIFPGEHPRMMRRSNPRQGHRHRIYPAIPAGADINASGKAAPGPSQNDCAIPILT